MIDLTVWHQISVTGILWEKREFELARKISQRAPGELFSTHEVKIA
jgi:hypothetical protein